MIRQPRIVVAGTNSGVGKTTVVAALCGALRKQGLRVSVFKCGPDYLDPTYHERAAGVPSLTLDGWMMGREGVLSTFQHGAAGSDISVIEGVMGLFDGVEPTSNAGSTAEIANWLEAPVLLVIDASGMSRSVAAMASGFAAFDPDLHIGGILCNRVGSKSHLEILRSALTQIPLLGGLPKDPGHTFPSRHLGLRTASESSVPEQLFDAWAAHATEWCDLPAILTLAQTAPDFTLLPVEQTVPHPTCRIGIAQDEAFHFYYSENLRMLRQAGAELVEFSPLADKTLPTVDGLYLGGGYPEVYAQALTENWSLRRQVFDFCNSGKPVYAECGGLMYLSTAIRQLDGSTYPMVGWFPAEAVMNSKLQALGYVEAETSQNTPIGPQGQCFRGHQFRYSTLEWSSIPECVYHLRRRRDGQSLTEGYRKGNVVASYVHAHWASNPSLAEFFVQACRPL